MPKIKFKFADIEFTSEELDFKDIIEAVNDKECTRCKAKSSLYSDSYTLRICVNWRIPFINIEQPSSSVPLNRVPIFDFSLCWD